MMGEPESELAVTDHAPKPRVAEFFAGIGLMRAGLGENFSVVWANDIDSAKARAYIQNFGAADFRHDDVRNVRGCELPSIDVATASFPCTDLSLAGSRGGLDAPESGMFWQFARVLDQLAHLRPPLVLLENVLGFATSRGGSDLVAALATLNRLGYWCDILTVDARWFVPQSRPRMFIVGSVKPLEPLGLSPGHPARPAWIAGLARSHPDLLLHSWPLPLPPSRTTELADVVERLPECDEAWWEGYRLQRFLDVMSPLQQARLMEWRAAPRLSWRTAYRRTRGGRAVWEVRVDDVAGCLRAVRGGSSRQALVEVGQGRVRARWLTPREYARLMGAPDYDLTASTRNEALFGFGDAVCIPAVRWVADNYLAPVRVAL